MIIKRFLTLEAVLAIGLGVVFLLPAHRGLGPAGIALTLPESVGMWTGVEAPVTAAELSGLAPDTGFARRIYSDPFGDQIYVSIVLSGADMTNSIHRPERCLPAQGWTVEESQRVAVPLGGSSQLSVTKLTNVREAHLAKTHEPIQVQQLDYYWFVGSRDITPSHWTRTFIDIKDRVLHGENQRWAYVTVASNVTKNLQRFGHTEAETSSLIEQFITQLTPLFQRPPAQS